MRQSMWQYSWPLWFGKHPDGNKKIDNFSSFSSLSTNPSWLWRRTTYENWTNEKPHTKLQKTKEKGTTTFSFSSHICFSAQTSRFVFPHELSARLVLFRVLIFHLPFPGKKKAHNPFRFKLLKPFGTKPNSSYCFANAFKKKDFNSS